MSSALKAALPGFNVLAGMVPFNVAALGNGRFHKGVAGDLVGRGSSRSRARSRRGSASDRAGSTLSDDMTGVAWGKLLINLNNAVNALSGRPLLEQLSDRDYRRVFAASQIEALEILKAAGIEPAKIGPFPPKLLPHVIGAPDFLFRRTGAEGPEDRRQRALVDGRRFRRRAADRDRLSERRGGRGWRTSSAEPRRSTRRSSRWSGRPRPGSSWLGAPRICAPMSSSAIAAPPASDIEALQCDGQYEPDIPLPSSPLPGGRGLGEGVGRR